MENINSISSEEELLKLRNEGKISESEYNDLLNTMKARPAEPKDALTDTEKLKSKRKLGKRAFRSMLAGIILPIIFLGICILSNNWILPNIYKLTYLNYTDMRLFHFDLDYVTPACFALWAAMEAVAFVLGVIAWPNTYGKATLASICFMFVISLLFIS